MTIRNFNSIYSSQTTENALDPLNQVELNKWDNKFEGLTLFNSQVRVAKVLTVNQKLNVGTDLYVNGTTSCNGQIYGANGAQIKGAVTMSNWANGVAGAYVLATVGGSNSTVVINASTTMNGSLNATGSVAFGNTLTVAGDTTLSGVLKGPAQFTIDPAAYGDETGTVTVRGNLVSNGTLAASGAVTVGGATTLNNTLYGAGNASFGGTLAASGAVAFGSTLNVVGNIYTPEISAWLGAFSNITAGGTLTVNQTCTLAYNTLVASNSAVTINKPTTINSALNVVGATTLNNTLYGAGASTFGATLAASGAVAFGSTLNVASTGSFGALTVSGNTTLSGVLRGPQNFIIDPAAYDNNTGTVTILGNLIVQGATTTINSTTLDVLDRNLTLSKGALSPSSSEGAGLSIELGPNGLGATGYADFKYEYFEDNFRVNKLIRCASGPVNVADLTNKAYVDARIVDAASTITPNTIGLSLINGFKFKVITAAVDFSGADICMTENNILYIWNNGGSFSVDLPYIHNAVPGVKSTPLYNGMNMFAYRVTAPNAEDHWTDSV